MDQDLATQEPDVPHRGLNVVDFDKPSLWWAVRRAVLLLPPRKRRLFLIASAFQISLGLLDLVGIALIGIVAAVAVSGINAAGIPPFVQRVLDFLNLSDVTVSQISVSVALLAVTILVMKTLLSALLSRRLLNFLANRQAEVSARLASEFLSRPLSDVNRWTTPEATYALGTGVGAATVGLLGNGLIIAAESFLFVVVGVTLLIIDPLLTLASVAVFVSIVAILHRVLGRWSARNAERMTGASIETLAAVAEAMVTYRESTVLNRRDLYIKRYENVVSRYARANATTGFILEIPKYVLEATLYLGILVLAVVQFLTKDWASAAAVTALFLAAASRIIPALLRLQGAGISIRNSAVMAQPTFFMADFLARTDPEGGDPGRSRTYMTAERIQSHIERGYSDFRAQVVVESVTLTYSDAAQPALLDVSLEVFPGRSLALVGSTGAGKSTLADVILGVMQPDSGTVDIGGLQPREAIDRWPGAIGYVPQAVALVAGTVRDNVALGLPRELIDDDQVWDALRRAHLAEFLIENREGLDTAIGERGFRLSGGQRQRLGIARALYTRPKLLILDEATSALDAETERAIIATLQELEGDVTTITVAHRLATVRTVDQLIYLADGRIVARGDFDELRNSVAEFDQQAALLGL